MSLLLLFRKRAAIVAPTLQDLDCFVVERETYAALYSNDGVRHMSYELRCVESSTGGPWVFHIRQKNGDVNLTGVSVKFWVGNGHPLNGGTTFLQINSPDSQIVIDTALDTVTVTLSPASVNTILASSKDAKYALILIGANQTIPFRAGYGSLRIETI